MHKLGLRDRYVLYFGTLSRRKNISTLLAAWRNVSPGLPGYSLVIAGGRGNGAVFAPDNGACGEHDRSVIRLGRVSDDDLPALLSYAEAFVLPSFYEGFGLPLIEAMSCGTCCLASAIPSLMEVGGNAALYFNPHHPAELERMLILALTDPETRASLKADSRAQALRFSWRRTAEETAAILEGAL